MFEKLKALFAKEKPEEVIYVPDDETEAENFDPGYNVTDEPESLPGHPAVIPHE